MGFAHVESSPLTRSSYHARDAVTATHRGLTGLVILGNHPVPVEVVVVLSFGPQRFRGIVLRSRPTRFRGIVTLGVIGRRRTRFRGIARIGRVGRPCPRFRGIVGIPVFGRRRPRFRGIPRILIGIAGQRGSGGVECLYEC